MYLMWPLELDQNELQNEGGRSLSSNLGLVQSYGWIEKHFYEEDQKGHDASSGTKGLAPMSKTYPNIGYPNSQAIIHTNRYTQFRS